MHQAKLCDGTHCRIGQSCNQYMTNMGDKIAGVLLVSGVMTESSASHLCVQLMLHKYSGKHYIGGL